MSLIIDVIKNTFSGMIRLFAPNDSNGSIKRKRTSDVSENIAPKRFRSCYIQTDNIDYNHSSYKIFTSRGEKVQSMSKIGSLYKPSIISSIRAPQSWNMASYKGDIEISSDEDNDVQLVSEEPTTSRCPLSSILVENRPSCSKRDNDIEVLNVFKKGKEPHRIGVQKSTSHVPVLSQTPSRRSDRFALPHSIKRDQSKSSMLENSTLRMAMQADDKATYSALLSNFFQNSPNLNLSSSSFTNLQDVEKRFQVLKPRRKSTVSPNVQFIDLTKPKGTRRSTRVPVTPATQNEGDSDVEIISVSSVPRVNSFDAKAKLSPYTSTNWLTELSADMNRRKREVDKQVKEERLKARLYAKHNQEQLDAVEERVRRYMTITDCVLIDEPVEPEVELPELTSEMEQRIKAALNPRPSNEVLVDKFSLSITRKDMNTLAKLNWLNDEVINFYMELLIERGKRDKMPKVYAFNTFFYPKLMNQGFSSLKRWTRKIDIFAHDIICIPVHLGVHWCMSIIDFKNKVVEYYDSMGCSNNPCLSALLQYLHEESMDKKKVPYDTSSWKTVNMSDIPQQMNGSDCGMFACTFAEYKCRNAKINFTQKDMPYFRRKMVYEILTCHLMIAND